MIRASDEMPSFFRADGEDSLIIDCGANIGVSVLEWKTRWPMARVLCFEPDPDAFRLLKLNVERNDIPGVECIEAAVSDFEGTTALYGEMGVGSDARGNSIQPEWGEREGSSSANVRCVRLSRFLHGRRVAFLKLDVEGAEESILREISGHMDRVEAMYVEVHENDMLDQKNALDRILKHLREAGMTVEQEERYQPHALPEPWSEWASMSNSRQTQLLCYRDES